MSLKKDNYKSSDKKIMNFAINLAENNKYLTGTNPSVGCVIVKNNNILSFATTNNGGRPHAESSKPLPTCTKSSSSNCCAILCRS